MVKNWRDPIHPGEHLAEELEEIGMTANKFEKALSVSGNRIYQIVNGGRDITADTARRRGKFFGTGPEIWMNLQQKYDLEIAEQKGGSLKEIKIWKPPKQKNSAQSGV